MVFVITSVFLCVTYSSFDSDTLSPAIIFVFHVLRKMLVDFREGHFLSIDGCDVPKGCFKQKGYLFWKHLIDDCKTLFNQFSFLGRFSYAVIFVVESAENVSSYLMIENSLQTDFVVL